MAPMNSALAVRSRLLGKPEDDFRDAPPRDSSADLLTLGWLGPLFFTAVGGIMRFWHVGAPHQLIFDETYYVKQGWSMILFGFEMKVDPVLEQAKQVDQHFTANDPFVWGHGGRLRRPPAGRQVAHRLGEMPFGILNSFGWRFAVALAGTLSILMVGRIARRLFQSDLLGAVAAALLAFEGHHFVHSRTGLLDIFVMFFGLAAFGALLIDRDKAREVLARAVWPGCRGVDQPVGTVARLAAVALGSRRHARSGGWREVVRALLPRLLRPAHRPVGPRGATIGRRARLDGGRRVKDGLFAFVQIVVTARCHLYRELDRAGS